MTPCSTANATVILQGMTSQFFSDLKSVYVHIDDIIEKFHIVVKHIRYLKYTCDHIQAAVREVKISKCKFWASEVECLRYILVAVVVRVDPKKIRPVKEARIPLKKKELKPFLRFCFFDRRFVKNFAKIAASFIF